MSRSQWAITASLKHSVGKAGDYGSASNRFLHLWTVAPDIDGAGGTVVSSTGGYAPVSCSSLFPTPSTSVQQVANDSVIQFTTSSSGAWGTVVAFSVHATTSPTSDMFFTASIDNPVTVSTGTNVSWPVGALVITES